MMCGSIISRAWKYNFVDVESESWSAMIVEEYNDQQFIYCIRDGGGHNGKYFNRKVLVYQECQVRWGPSRRILHLLHQNLGPSPRKAMYGEAMTRSSQIGRKLLDRSLPAHQSVYSHFPRQASLHRVLKQIGRIPLACWQISQDRSLQASQYCSVLLQATRPEMVLCGCFYPHPKEACNRAASQ